MSFCHTFSQIHMQLFPLQPDRQQDQQAANYKSLRLTTQDYQNHAREATSTA
jgi:hypothetical protein